MIYIHYNNEIDKRINVSKIANNISTMGDDRPDHLTIAGAIPRYIRSDLVKYFDTRTDVFSADIRRVMCTPNCTPSH